jgi:hypothetical protein
VNPSFETAAAQPPQDEAGNKIGHLPHAEERSKGASRSTLKRMNRLLIRHARLLNPARGLWTIGRSAESLSTAAAIVSIFMIELYTGTAWR